MNTFLRPYIARFGELKARQYLVKKGYKIIATNWRLKYGELDIIAVDRNELVFVEVKARKATVDTCFPAADAVNFKKIEKIKVISDYYLDRNKNMIEKLKIKRIRHDVIGVSVNSFFSFSIDHRIDAF